MTVIGDWTPLGLGKNVFYSKYDLYSMRWVEQVDPSKVLIVAAPYGGPIAVTRDDSKIVKVQGSTKKVIFIYSAAGQKLSEFVWNSGRIIHMGWSCSEDLLCVQDDGQVLVYSLLGKFKRVFGMGQEAKDTGAVDCRIFSTSLGTGLAVLAGSYRIFTVNNVDSPTLRRLAEIPGLDAPPSSWAVFNVDRQTRALVAKDADLYLLDQEECQQQTLSICQPVLAYAETLQAEEEMRLLRWQAERERSLGKPYLGTSLQATMSSLMLAGQHKMAEELRKDFKVPDRRFWWMKIKALSSVGDWAELEKFSRSKKSPIGYEPFVEACAEYRNMYEAKNKYIPRVAAENKVKFYTVILRLKKSLKTGEFLMSITRIPVAYALYLQLCRQQNREMLRDMFYQTDNFNEEAYCFIHASYQQKTLDHKLSNLQASVDSFSKAKNDFMAKQAEEEMKACSAGRPERERSLGNSLTIGTLPARRR
ncbi:PREDICTED: vacuolar protein sorting-associated protein 16 homolog [Priapulus caudatus]|uniref:Vacuolar protein sorting-associated protein 16 homolog n=1 Tax=Priapulus caudatus TaxID=37621 RepID=A0ABM1EV84_PRICU|nr:PREDICTED: vacuolar protein sorting-associated protein 16 homolog [Priapulus caudatus]